VERKKVELPGNTFKSVGKYKVTVKLYESASAEINVTVQAQIIKTETREPVRKDRRRHYQPDSVQTTAAETAAEDTAARESVSVADETPGTADAAPGTADAAPATENAAPESTLPAETDTE
jgi:large subunit ribosomal protein L9